MRCRTTIPIKYSSSLSIKLKYGLQAPTSSLMAEMIPYDGIRSGKVIAGELGRVLHYSMGRQNNHWNRSGKTIHKNMHNILFPEGFYFSYARSESNLHLPDGTFLTARPWSMFHYSGGQCMPLFLLCLKPLYLQGKLDDNVGLKGEAHAMVINKAILSGEYFKYVRSWVNKHLMPSIGNIDVVYTERIIEMCYPPIYESMPHKFRTLTEYNNFLTSLNDVLYGEPEQVSG